MKNTLQATAVVLATTAGLLTVVAAPTASAATTCTSPVFKRQFFANTTFKGTPKKTDCDSTVSESWSGAPASGLPKDNFGVRWSVTRDFGSGGPFALAASGLDGIRVYLDGVRKVDLWKNTTKTVSKTVNVTVPKGKHTLRIDYVNWTGAAKVKFAYTPRTSAAVDKVKPLTPLDPLVSYDVSANTTKLSWTKNREMDLAGYRVYRRLRGSTSWTKTGTTTATSLTDAPPATGDLYYYEVRAYDKAGNESTGTADALVTSTVLQTPAGFTASATDTGAELSWTGVHAAVKYRVERTDFYGVVTKSWDLAYTVTLTDDSLTRGETVKYRVASVDGSGHVSPFTDLKAVTRPLAPPRELTATAGIGSATLQWTMKAEDTPYGDFRVYRSTTLPVDTSTAQWVTCTTSFTTLSDGSRRYSCGDFSAEEGTTYHYAVANVQWPSVSPLSNTATVTTLESDKPPAQVTGLTATATEYGIELDWDDNTEPDLLRYVVYRGTVLGEEGEEQVCSGGEWAWLNAGTSHYRDVRTPDGDHACYWVDAIDTAGNSSRWLGPVSAVAVDELDLTPSVATPEGAPLTLTADTPDSGGVRLGWSAVDSATGYQVYRWDPATKTYEKLAATTDRSYDDTTATRGTTHYYWVTALYADGTESAPGADRAILEP
ncbi:PA14 domain-containing protein [Streptomyces sp. NPDC004237]|uniref:PA14 domain-containing protein n=1 Tax=Streptomyces sp. NPDC004237 TaxID=3154455 RepID=UPI0033A82B48